MLIVFSLKWALSRIYWNRNQQAKSGHCQSLSTLNTNKLEDPAETRWMLSEKLIIVCSKRIRNSMKRSPAKFRFKMSTNINTKRLKAANMIPYWNSKITILIHLIMIGTMLMMMRSNSLKLQSLNKTISTKKTLCAVFEFWIIVKWLVDQFVANRTIIRLWNRRNFIKSSFECAGISCHNRQELPEKEVEDQAYYRQRLLLKI